MSEASDIFADHESERMVLGAVVVDNAAMNILADMLVPRHFDEKKHQRIWDGMLGLYGRSQPIDPLMLKAELADDLESAGGMDYLVKLDEGIPRVTNPEQWAGTVVERARRRAARTFAGRFMDEINNPQIETEDLIERFQDQLTKMQAARRDGLISMRDVMPQSIAWLEKFSQSTDGMLGIPSGLPDVDRMLCGWQKGGLYIVAARPGRGKSVLCAQSSVFAALRGYKVLYCGLEMKPSATTVRMICGQAAVDRWDLRLRNGNQERFEYAWAQVNRAAGQMVSLGITFDQREAPTVAQIKAVAKQHQAAKGCDLLIVDYLQRCSLPSDAEKQWVAVGDIAKNLKSLAQALNIPVIAACQLNAEAEKIRPHQGHLAQARGVISAEADAIIFLHPPDVDAWQSKKSDEMTFIVDKQRDGPTGDIPLSFERNHNRFVSSANTFVEGEF